MDEKLVAEMLARANASSDHAAVVRAMHRKRTLRGTRQRETEIEHAMNRLRRAMRPIRSELGRTVYQRQNALTPFQHQTLLEASEAIQRERRKLWKMQSKEARNAHKRKRRTGR